MTGSYRDFALRTPRFSLNPTYPVSIFEPAVFSATDSHALSGHGFGFDSGVHLKAIGEYLERHGAFRAIRATSRGRLDETGLSMEELAALRRALHQTCVDEAYQRVDDHTFGLVKVRRLADDDVRLYPSVFFSLHSVQGNGDAEFLPLRDTSGSAIHPQRATAFQSALLEFVERQCTTAMWVSRRCNTVRPLAPVVETFGKAWRTATQMSRMGNLELYDISFLRGVKVHLAVFTSKVEESIINFSCGCAAGYDGEEVAVKALIEAWQTSLLLPQMEFFGVNEYGSSQLKEDFRSANRHDFDLGVYVDPLTIGSGTSSNIDSDGDLVQSILDVSDCVYVYEKELMVSGVRMWFCRIVSPDFFVHMSPAESNNNRNKWIDKFCPIEGRRLDPLPFS